MNIFSVYPSAYFKAADLAGEVAALKIAGVETVEFEDETKPVIKFAGTPKGLVLNKTNAIVIADAYGAETDGWKGKVIEIFPARVQFGSRMVDAVRVRVPTKKEIDAGL